MSGTRFKPEPGAVRKIRLSPEYAAGTRRIAHQVKQHVKAAAPQGGTGYYERSITVIGSAVASTDSFAHLIEFGSVNNPPYAPLRRGVIAAGLRLDESRI